ncbi:hypothetical protein AusDCA_4229 [Desulfitobacterium sp. AusDCA]
MPSYFYIAILIALCVYPIIRSVYLFQKGKYTLYFQRGTNKDIILGLGWSILYIWSLDNAELSHFSYLVISLVFIFFYILCISILGYLSYRKMRERRVIYSTVILDIFLIAVSLFIVNLYLHHQ